MFENNAGINNAALRSNIKCKAAYVYASFERTNEPRHEISNNVRPAKPQISLHSLIRAFASRLNIL